MLPKIKKAAETFFSAALKFRLVCQSKITHRPFIFQGCAFSPHTESFINLPKELKGSLPTIQEIEAELEKDSSKYEKK